MSKTSDHILEIERKEEQIESSLQGVAELLSMLVSDYYPDPEAEPFAAPSHTMLENIFREVTHINNRCAEMYDARIAYLKANPSG